ncbi:MAG: threonine aldolase family protein [Alphaproteobacteria bacterium]
MIRVDLASDTKTRPTPAMRRAMAEAQVGDEQAFEDPTVNALCERVADLLGHEAAVFLPSGTMANQIAFRLLTRPGDEVLVEASTHPLHFESGGPAANAYCMFRPLAGVRGKFTAAQVTDAVRGGYRHHPRTSVVAIENTTNMGGGAVWTVEEVAAVAAAARAHGLKLHMDGARLANAAVAQGVPLAAYGGLCDTVWLDFSKGLGAPVGACLAGSAAAIDEAWRIKQQLGGAMRQAGIVAAAALYALDHHLDRLAEDHARAARLAAAIAEIDGLALVNPPVETNLVFFSTEESGWSAPALSEALAARGVRIGAMGPHHLRACTHLDVDDAAIEAAIAGLRAILAG